MVYLRDRFFREQRDLLADRRRTVKVQCEARLCAFDEQRHRVIDSVKDSSSGLLGSTIREQV